MNEQTIKLLLETQAEGYKAYIELLIKKTDEKENKLMKEMNELRTSLEFTQNELDNLKAVIPELKKQDQQQGESVSRMQQLEDKLNYLDDYNRRDNLIIDGMFEDAWETSEQTQVKVTAILSEKLDLPGVTTIQAHRIGKMTQGKQRPVMVRFKEHHDRDATLRNARKLKGTKIFINEDFCIATRKLREALLPQLREARSQGKIAFIRYNQVITREKRPRPQTSQHPTLPSSPGPHPPLALPINQPSITLKRPLRVLKPPAPSQG